MSDWHVLADNVRVPDLLLLANRTPQLGEHVINNSADKSADHRKRLKLDSEKPKLFYTREANRLLAQALAAEYFGLDLQLSPDHLCPRIGNRLDYLLWVFSDILGISPDISSNYCKILDVGTGSSCIYPLLGSVLIPTSSWIATDISDESLTLASSLLDLNPQVKNQISLVHTSESGPFFNLQSFGCGHLDATMCNPPFYADREEMIESRTSKLLPPKSSLEATDNELFTAGGEAAFLLRMFEESLSTTDITWFTTMVGKKSTLQVLVERFKEKGLSNYSCHEIIQGSGTRRWTVAWTLTNYHGRSRLHSASLRNLNPIVFVRELIFPVASNYRLHLVKIQSALSLLALSTEWLDKSHGILQVSSHGDVWSRGFRRKSHEQKAVQLANEQNIEQFRLEWILDRESKPVPRFVALNIWWIYGTDSRVFDSFFGYVNSLLADNPKFTS